MWGMARRQRCAIWNLAEDSDYVLHTLDNKWMNSDYWNSLSLLRNLIWCETVWWPKFNSVSLEEAICSFVVIRGAIPYIQYMQYVAVCLEVCYSDLFFRYSRSPLLCTCSMSQCVWKCVTVICSFIIRGSIRYVYAVCRSVLQVCWILCFFIIRGAICCIYTVCCSVLKVCCSAVFCRYSMSHCLYIIFVVCRSVLEVCCSALFFRYSMSPFLNSPFPKRCDPQWSSGFKTESWMVEVQVFFQMSRITRELWWSFKDSDSDFDDYVGSYLFGNGLYICNMLQCVELCCSAFFFLASILM